MTNWEYKVEPVATSNHKAMENHFNLWGDQGWELVAIGPSGVVFKRAK